MFIRLHQKSYLNNHNMSQSKCDTLKKEIAEIEVREKDLKSHLEASNRQLDENIQLKMEILRQLEIIEDKQTHMKVELRKLIAEKTDLQATLATEHALLELRNKERRDAIDNINKETDRRAEIEYNNHKISQCPCIKNHHI